MDQETLGAALALAKKNAVSESVIQNKVEGWLNAHPEKTTTVQDGAISYSKLDASLKEKADDVSQLKNALNAMNTATAEDEGKALKAKTVTNGKVTEWEFGEAGGVDPADIEQAVDDYLDAHPEQTTTVVDGSLTEAKFTAATWADIVNNFVTPQMFGAVADGTTDDTTALQAAFDSDKDVYIPSGSYLTSGVTITTTKTIYVESLATFKAMTLGQDHVISATATIYTHGTIYIDGDYKALIGLKLDASSNHIDSVTIDECLFAGLYVDHGSGSRFGRVRTVSCGTKITVTGSYEGFYALSITGTMMDRERTVLESGYACPFYFFNTGDYTSTFSGRWFDKAISFDSTNDTIGTPQTAAGRLPSAYTNKETVLCIGGGIYIGPNCLMQMTFDFIDTRLGAAGIFIGATYGHVINSYYSQSDYVPVAVATYNLGMLYNSITFEGSRCGYNFISWTYDKSVITTTSTNGDDLTTTSSMIAVSTGYSKDYVPVHLKTIARRVLPGGRTVSGNVVISETSSDVFITTYNSAITLTLYDTFGNGWTLSPDGFGVKTIIFFPETADQQTADIVFTLSSDLTSKGYSIYNWANSELRITRPAVYVKATVMQFKKVFYVTIEPITFAAPSA